MGLKIILHNVQGFNPPYKRKKAFQHYKRLGANIILLQETHFSSSNYPKYFEKTYNQFYYITFNNKTRGVAIFTCNSIILDIQNIYKDTESRFIIIKGSINNRTVTIASIYAPNESQSSFFTNLFEILDRYSSPHIILSGDFNLASHPALDRSKVSPSSKAFSKSLIRSINNLQLNDSWRAHNVGIKAYTYYSHPHKVYARLDYIFCTPILLANSSKALIHPCPWSDHNIPSFETTHIGLTPSPFNWRLNDSILTDPSIIQSISTHIENYFIENTNDETPPTILWAAHKAVLRGQLISLAANKNRLRLTDIKCFTKDLNHLYNKLQHSPSQELTRQIQEKCQALVYYQQIQKNHLDSQKLNFYSMVILPQPC